MSPLPEMVGCGIANGQCGMSMPAEYTSAAQGGVRTRSLWSRQSLRRSQPCLLRAVWRNAEVYPGSAILAFANLGGQWFDEPDTQSNLLLTVRLGHTIHFGSAVAGIK